MNSYTTPTSIYAYWFCLLSSSTDLQRLQQPYRRLYQEVWVYMDSSFSRQYFV